MMLLLWRACFSGTEGTAQRWLGHKSNSKSETMSSIDHFLSSFFIDPTTLPHTPTGFIQLLILLCAYGYVLFCGSNMISDGSELLLFIPSIAGIVGSVVLPILGAVPDGAMILFSGLGPDAKEQVKVGVGALAGSTIMLLTGEL